MSSPFQAHRLRELRTEHGWPEADLATKIDSDARQVSRYEGGKVAPGMNTVVRIAETFDIAVDYLVIARTPRRPVHAPTNALADHFRAFTTLPPSDQAALFRILDAFGTKICSAPSPTSTECAPWNTQ